MTDLKTPPLPPGVEDILRIILDAQEPYVRYDGERRGAHTGSGVEAIKLCAMGLSDDPYRTDAIRAVREIAARCRCAWLDEESRLEDVLDRIKAPYPEPWDSVPTWSERNAARANAEAWRVWGILPEVKS